MFDRNLFLYLLNYLVESDCFSQLEIDCIFIDPVSQEGSADVRKLFSRLTIQPASGHSDIEKVYLSKALQIKISDHIIVLLL